MPIRRWQDLWTAFGKRWKTWSYDASTNGKCTNAVLCVPGPDISVWGALMWTLNLKMCHIVSENYPPSFWRERVLRPQWGQQGTGLGYLWGNLWQEHAAITFDLAKGKGGLCPETKTSTFLLLFLLPEMPGLEEEWPEWWKQWNKMLQNVTNSICQVGSGFRELQVSEPNQPCYFSLLYSSSLLLFLIGKIVEVKMCGNGGTFHWSKCNLSVKRENINFHRKAKNLRNIPYKTNLFIKKKKTSRNIFIFPCLVAEKFFDL